MAKKKETKQSPMQRLFVYAGKYKYLTIASWILAAISAFVALVPFYFIWRIIKEVLYFGLLLHDESQVQYQS